MKLPYRSVQFWIAMLGTIALVVCIRELALIVCQAFGMASAANIVGLVSLFMILMLLRLVKGELPHWLSSSASILLVDSGFAFLPVSAGAGILLFGLGDEFFGVTMTIILSVIVPLWAFAKLAEKWLAPAKGDAHADT